MGYNMDMADPFETFSSRAFRFEGLSHYADDADGGSGEVEFFRQHGTAPEGHNREWAEMVGRARARGGVVMRLRLVSVPLSDYESFELRAGYDAGRQAGEEIRVAESARGHGDYPDYWLYDDRELEIMHYGSAGEFLGSTVRPFNEDDRAMIRAHQELFASAVTPEVFLREISSR